MTNVAVVVAALLLLSGSAASIASPVVASEGPPVAIQARNGSAGGDAATKQGSDQGEDQGENIAQYGSGSALIGPTRVRAPNAIQSGDVGGGSGGSVTVTINNHLTTLCGAATTSTIAAPVSLAITSGSGGGGGSTGAGQGADQGEDQGENVGQFSSGNASVAPVMVTAVNRIRSGDARGGKGGDVNVTVNTYTTCGSAKASVPPTPPPTATINRDTAGNVSAAYTFHVTCAAVPTQRSRSRQATVAPAEAAAATRAQIRARTRARTSASTQRAVCTAARRP